MRKTLVVLWTVCLLLNGQQQRRRSQQQQQPEVFHTQVPAQRFNLTLGRPEATSVTATILTSEDLEGYLSTGTKQTAVTDFRKAVPTSIVLSGLTANTPYVYRFHFRKPGTKDFETSPPYSFHTQRPPGSTFSFAVQADSHLDQNADPATYQRTLANILAAKPDFLIDLGDTFMTDKRRIDFRASLPQYLAQRYYFGSIAHSVPLFLLLGNHDGEGGALHNGNPDSMAAWSLANRTRYFPNPRPNGFYSGNATPDPQLGPLENYYAWKWGGALFIALDPFWPTTSRARRDNWRWTLGRTQYDWLKKTLAESREEFKFVFIHHPVGAKGEPIRGGIAAAAYCEWGGKNEDGTEGFREKRPGWDKPIHQLLVKHKVNAVFHGHDHFYAREELDGIVYQLVPQPGGMRKGEPRNAGEYGYTSGKILGGAGYLRVTVTLKSATVDYVESEGVKESYRISAGPRK